MIEALGLVFLFVISLGVLIKAADYFTQSAERIGLYLGMPSFVVGVTIVALGTSIPELISSIFAVLAGSSEIVAGNVVGSNIANIFLVLGVTAIVGKKLKISYELAHVDLPFLLASAFLLAVMIWDGVFTLGEAIYSLVGMLLYLAYTLHSEEAQQAKVARKKNKQQITLPASTWIILLVSAGFIFLGAKYTIASIISLSALFAIGTEVIALSAVALGTSLPELLVSVQAARAGKAEMAVGNVLGSNIFNTFIVMGIPALLGPLYIPANLISFSLPIMIIATLIYLSSTQDHEITQWEGAILVLFYLLFVGKLFALV